MMMIMIEIIISFAADYEKEEEKYDLCRIGSICAIIASPRRCSPRG